MTPEEAAARSRARQIVLELAERLADPVEVAARHALARAEFGAFGRPEPPWHPPSLAEGNTGVALLFAELSRSGGGPRHRRAASAHLSAAVEDPTALAPGGLYQGAAAVAFAVSAAARGREDDDYAALLAGLESWVTRHLDQLLTAETERLDEGRSGVSLRAYNATSGVAGLARYLLLRRPRPDETLTRALAYLVRLTHPVTAHGHRVPGWWAPRGTGPEGADPAYPRGHLNLGLAHGIPGPLALLALAWEAGERVPGQDVAIAHTAEWLLARRTAGQEWPSVLSFDQHTGRDPRPPRPGRVAWCYGTPGVARALYLAGRAFSRADWQRAAVDSLLRALNEARGLSDCSLCHGWAGVLHTTWRMARDSADDRLAAWLPRLVRPVLAAYEPMLPFGFRYHVSQDPGAGHRAGFLEGAAGIALALHTFTADAPPATAWDAALLLS